MQFFCDNKPLKQESRLRNSSSARHLAWYKKESYYFWNDFQNIKTPSNSLLFMKNLEEPDITKVGSGTIC